MKYCANANERFNNLIKIDCKILIVHTHNVRYDDVEWTVQQEVANNKVDEMRDDVKKSPKVAFHCCRTLVLIVKSEY